MLVYVIKLSADYSRIKTKLEQAENNIKYLLENDEKQDKRNSEKFTELFNARTRTAESLTELTTTMKLLISSNDKHFEQIERQIEKLEVKIEEIKGGR